MTSATPALARPAVTPTSAARPRPGGLGTGEDDGRFPRLAAGVARPQHERALAGVRRWCRRAMAASSIASSTVGDVVGVTVVEERRLVDARRR